MLLAPLLSLPRPQNLGETEAYSKRDLAAAERTGWVMSQAALLENSQGMLNVAFGSQAEVSRGSGNVRCWG